MYSLRRSALLCAANTTKATPAPPTEKVLKQVQGKRPSTMYRQFLKLFIKRFDTDHKTIVRAWKQCKYEFWYYRGAKPEQVLPLMIRAQEIYNGIQAHVVPVYTNKEGKTWCKYDKDLLDAAENHVDPVPADEFVKRFHDKIDPKDLAEIQGKLAEHGRWEGPTELTQDTLARRRFKTKKKKKCTDEDPPEEGAEKTAAKKEEEKPKTGFEHLGEFKAV